MVKKYSVVVTNPTSAIRYCGSFCLRGHHGECHDLTEDRIKQLKSAGFIVDFKDSSLEEIDSDSDMVELEEESVPECFGIEYDDYEDCDGCNYREGCRDSMVELELTNENPDVDTGVEIPIVNKNLDQDSGVKFDITSKDPDSDPIDNESDWTNDNLENINDD